MGEVKRERKKNLGFKYPELRKEIVDSARVLLGRTLLPRILLNTTKTSPFLGISPGGVPISGILGM